MNIFDKFNPLEAGNQNAPTQDPRNTATPTYQQQPMRGVEVPNQNPNDATNPPKSGVDVLDEVWDTDLSKFDKDSKIKQMEEKDFGELAKNYNPTISDDEMAEAMEDPAKFKAVMASVAKQALAASTNISSQISSNYVEQASKLGEARMARSMEKNAVMAEIKTLNKSLTSVKPFREMTETMVAKFLAKHPGSDPKEAASKISDYVAAQLGITKAEEETSSTPTSKDTEADDWTSFLD